MADHYHVNVDLSDRFTPEQLELFRRVVKQIETEPERWRQDAWVSSPAFDAWQDAWSDWYYDEVFFRTQPEPEEIYTSAQVCDTAFCVAGWACALTDPDFEYSIGSVRKDGEIVGTIEDVARDLLGLTQIQAEQLFEGENTLSDVKTLITHYTGIKFEE